MAKIKYEIGGKRVPSVTTIISRFKDSGGLIHWAWQQGMDGLDYRETRDKAALAGHLAHYLMELDARGKTKELKALIEEMNWRGCETVS
jgi:hypothetical protein